MTTKREILDAAKKHDVSSLRLQFTDILGVNKNVEVPQSQFEKALEGDIMFDGSSIEGFVRIEESDMVLRPDLDTFRVLPNGDAAGRVARVICDIYNPDGSAFAGCTRQALKRQIARAKALGYAMMAGVEAEFFIFQLDGEGNPTTITHDHGGYFDQTPVDRAEEIRRLIVKDLVAMGFEVEAGHHEVAPGQHEIDFRYAEALETERLGDAHAPVAVQERRQRVPRSQGAVGAVADRDLVHRRAAGARARLLRRHEPAREQLQTARAGV
jgi:glutamine synthetase